MLEAIEKGMDDSKAGKTKNMSEIRGKYGLTELKSKGEIVRSVVDSGFRI